MIMNFHVNNLLARFVYPFYVLIPNWFWGIVIKREKKMSPTFIRLQHFVLASLIAAGTIHLSLSFAEAAPTSLTNDFLPRDAVPPSIDSNFAIGLAVQPRVSSDSHVDCVLDPSDSRCGAPPLLRRTISDDRIASMMSSLERFSALGDDPTHMKDRFYILTSQGWVIFRIMTTPEASIEAKATARVARRKYSEFLSSRPFQKLMGKMATRDLGNLLLHLRVRDPESHDSAVTPVVLQCLQRADISTDFTATTQAYVVANEVVNLLDDPNASMEYPNPISEHGVFKPNEYLSKYRDLLIRQEYIPWPGDANIDNTINHHESTAATSQSRVDVREGYITGILLRYSQWAKSKDKVKLVDLQKHFEGELKRNPPLPPAIRVVLKAYLWVLSDRNAVS
ncbi:hypothetical protein H0H93_014446 [Arthromyces matolae]|nr:hypothetical protein H0H93_014446 [Arthromyces matolae]